MKNSLRCMKHGWFLAIVLVAGIWNRPVVGDTIFVLDDTVPAFADGINNGDAITVDGVTLTFSNVVVADGSEFGDVEDFGILLSSTTEAFTDVIQFDFSFNQDVQINTYDIGAREDVPASSFFTVTGSNGTSGNNLIPAGTSFTEVKLNFDPGTIAVFEAGEVYTFTHNLPSSGDPLFNLEEFAVTVIPEPGACWMIALGVVALGYRRRNR